jgi:nucleotide-binding universal stress UspA family protein
MKVPATGYRLELVNKIDTVDSIISFAQKESANYIIISTRGAGTLKKLYGTNTSSLISKSPLPVICVPSSCRVKPVSKLLYASDMTNYEQELKQVVSFARPINATIEMLHVAYPFELILDKQLAEQSLSKKVGYGVNLHYTGHGGGAPLMALIGAAIKISKTDLLVMFTNQERSFFERVFLSSSAQTYSFNAKVPMLSFKKTAGLLQA